MNTELTTIDSAGLETKASQWPAIARELTVVDAGSYATAGELLTGIKALRREIDDCFNPPIAAAHAAHKSILDAKKKVEAPLVEAEGTIKRSMGTWAQEEERKRREAQHQAEAAARKEAEDRRLDAAEALERAGMAAEAEAVVSRPVEVKAAPIESAVPKVAGIGTREMWKTELLDLDALIRWVALEPASRRGCLLANPSYLTMLARDQKEAFNVPGVRAWRETGIAAS